MKKFFFYLLYWLAACCLLACGQAGPLYLPTPAPIQPKPVLIASPQQPNAIIEQQHEHFSLPTK